MAKFAIPNSDRSVAGPIALTHLGQTVDTLRAALTTRLKYDPVAAVRDVQHLARLQAMGALIIEADDTTGRILVVG